ncbi:stage II sporulation protein D [Ruminococcus sp. FC2018]|uniref:stage II sporulation protein D n=1 Tax=Ruminococcus sp. FC2018 TaxID=1410617 RepID=UPI00048CD123|nr:stage II sporulation protein D [Ruminococcus sp. FC2018]
MKEYIQSTVVFAIMLLIIPCVVFLGANKPVSAQDENASSAQSSHPAEEIIPSGEKVKIYFTKEDTVSEYTMEEYVLGAVMAQMPSDFEPAALQAQAVLARTYALHRTKSESSHPTAELKGAVMSDDTGLYQAFFTPQQAKDFYKDSYEQARSKILEAVKATQNKFLSYADEPVLIAFHAVSCGYTASAKEAWGQDIPYLSSVESKPDETLKISGSEIAVTEERFKEIFLEADKDIKTDGPADNWLKITETGSHGYVLSAQVFGKTFTGTSVCQLLGLNSPVFTVQHSDGKFVFTTKGVGHMVGMSQFGANEMAKQGKSCDDILTHYFPGTKLGEISSQGT